MSITATGDGESRSCARRLGTLGMAGLSLPETGRSRPVAEVDARGAAGRGEGPMRAWLGELGGAGWIPGPT